jgi:Tol biopolymer transport system component
MLRYQRVCYPVIVLALISLLLLAATAALHTAQAQSDQYCFEETGYCIEGRIREYWESNGGLLVFGLPTTELRTEEVEGRALQVQWFERNRLELHPQNERPYDVLLGRLGEDVLLHFNRDWKSFPTSQPQEGCLYFEETQQNICGDFLQAWRADGLELDNEAGKTVSENLALFGLPISPPQVEVIEGQDYTVQWFERARFELHPEHEPPYHVLQGLLGNELRTLLDTTPTPTTEPTPAPTGEPTPVPTGEPTPPPDGPTGRIVFVSDRDGNFDIYTMNADGSAMTRLTTDPGPDMAPAWAPDGSRVVFVSERDDNKEIYVMNSDGSNQVNLTNHPDADEEPAWSPDGSKIVFRSNRDGRAQVYTINPDGSELTRVSTSTEGDDYDPAWSPDGTQIAFVSNRDQNAEIYVMNADGSGAANLTNHPATETAPAWASDGSRIAFQTQRDGNWQVYTMNPDGSQPANISNSTSSDQGPGWSPDSQYLTFYTDRGPGFFDVYIMSRSGAGVSNLTNNADTADWFPAWGP